MPEAQKPATALQPDPTGEQRKICQYNVEGDPEQPERRSTTPSLAAPMIVWREADGNKAALGAALAATIVVYLVGESSESFLTKYEGQKKSDKKK